MSDLSRPAAAVVVVDAARAAGVPPAVLPAARTRPTRARAAARV